MFQPGESPDGADLAIAGWNLMGGIDWSAMETVVEILGVTNVELFLQQLATIRSHEAKKHG